MNGAIHAEQFEAYSAQLLEKLKGIGYSDSTLAAYRSALNKVEQYISTNISKCILRLLADSSLNHTYLLPVYLTDGADI
ncbi:MAG: hypothetical protein ACYC0N_03830 [Carboxydocellales bacterium]